MAWAFAACGEVAPTNASRDAGSPDTGAFVDTVACERQQVEEDAEPLPDAGFGSAGCRNYQRYSCGLPDSGPAIQLHSSCYFAIDDCNTLCPGIVFS